MRHARNSAALLAAVAVVSSLSTIPASAESTSDSAAENAAENYVALGDSYSSGTGTREYFEDSGDCLRSPKAYPQLWADSHQVSSFEFAACSGAVTGDVIADQLGGLNADTTLATISIGGNDVGFADVITRCVAGTDSACDAAVTEAIEKARNELPAKLDATYASIREAAPNA